MKKFLFSVFLISLFSVSAYSQKSLTAELLEFRVQATNYTKNFSGDVQVKVETRRGVKYLDVTITSLGNGWGSKGDTVEWKLYNDSNDAVLWKTDGDRNYLPVSDYVCLL